MIIDIIRPTQQHTYVYLLNVIIKNKYCVDRFLSSYMPTFSCLHYHRHNKKCLPTLWVNKSHFVQKKYTYVHCRCSMYDHWYTTTATCTYFYVMFLYHVCSPLYPCRGAFEYMYAIRWHYNTFIIFTFVKTRSGNLYFNSFSPLILCCNVQL